MSTNCLVTKLKSVVDNDSLPKLGQLVYKVSGKTEYIFNISGKANSGIRIYSNTITSVVTNGEKTVTLPYTFMPGPSGTIIFKFNTQSNDDVADIIFEKYGDIPGFIISSNEYASLSLWLEEGINALNYGNFIGKSIVFIGEQNIGNIEDLKIKSTSNIIFYRTNIKGNISSYFDSYSPEEKQAVNYIDFFKSNYLEGDVQSFSECTNCIYLRVDNTHIGGNIETMLNNMVANGRQSGQMTLRTANSLVVRPSEMTNPGALVTFVPISDTYPKGYYFTPVV